MRLITSTYQTKSVERARELDKCRYRNALNPLISHIHLIVEDGVDLSYDEKFIYHKLGRRATFSDYFDVAASFPGETFVVANSDVYFDFSLAEVIRFDLDKQFLVIGRHGEVDLAGCVLDKFTATQQLDCQDSWIFKAPCRFRADWFLGVRGCDNRLAYEALIAGYEVVNPANYIRAFHLHVSQERTYGEVEPVPGPYLPVSVLA